MSYGNPRALRSAYTNAFNTLGTPTTPSAPSTFDTTAALQALQQAMANASGGAGPPGWSGELEGLRAGYGDTSGLAQQLQQAQQQAVASQIDLSQFDPLSMNPQYANQAPARVPPLRVVPRHWQQWKSPVSNLSTIDPDYPDFIKRYAGEKRTPPRPTRMAGY